ncbi:hypothetical protein AMK06_PE00406 (plasmid) [Rhizobium sp. N541]|nr:hypothetical protein AMK05_PE00409 [Rhizobium sp. N324]ANM21166.1 hypothetical protein AMK06_PE00406 [Rhizobium sp. N541]ANM27537.1 hypothetical protein AMK07_PE00406 [Rhizobium sp. N941]OYC99880.1 hypothetical protein AMK08_PE00407 [Rhizobium sp. N4311]
MAGRSGSSLHSNHGHRRELLQLARVIESQHLWMGWKDNRYDVQIRYTSGKRH